MSTDERFGSLWTDYLEGELDQAAHAELRALLASNAALQKRAADAFQVHRLLGFVAMVDAAEDFVLATMAKLPASREQFVLRLMQRVQKQPEAAKSIRPAWLRVPAILAAAAAVALLGVVAWLAWPMDKETGLMLASADSTVKVERDGAVLMLPVGALLLEEDVVMSEEAGIVVSYPEEETRLELSPKARLEVLAHREGKRLRLQSGTVSAEVSPQPEGRPMRLFTPNAEAVVLGTRFTMNADVATPELAVQKGAVRVNRATGDSIVVSAEERVKLGARLLELEPLPPPPLPRWRDEHTLAFDFETEVTWPALRCGRVVAASEGGHCLAGELVEVVGRHGERLVLATSLRPQCVSTKDTRLRFRYRAAPGIENIEVFLYVFGVDRAFKATSKIEAHGRWIEWTIPFKEMLSASATPPAAGSVVRSISLHTSPIEGPLPFHIDDVVLEHVSVPPPVSR